MFTKQHRWRLLLLGAVLSLVTVVTWAATPHIAWVPARLAPESLAPGATTSHTVALRNVGPKPLSETPHLIVEARGEITPYITVNDPGFRNAIQAGETVGVTVRVTAPPDAPLSVKRGELVLLRRLSDGITKEEFMPHFPVELTFSTIPLPGDPGEAGKQDLLGIDTNNNGVRDDIERFIVFGYPESAKKREALMQNARMLHAFVRDHQDKAKTRSNGGKVMEAAIDCLNHVFNDDLDASDKAGAELIASFLNTKERSRAYRKANAHMGGYVSDSGPASQRLNRQKVACTFNPDSLPN